MRILGLDVSTHTGWALLETDNTHDLGVSKRGHGELTAPNSVKGLKRLEYFQRKVQGIVDKYDPDVIFIEGYGYANKFTLVTLVELGTAIRLQLVSNSDILIIEVPPSTLKQFVTGKGIAKKDKMMVEVYKTWGFTGTDNEADAYALAQFGMAFAGVTNHIPIRMTAINNWMAKSGTVEKLKWRDKLQLIAKN